MRLIGQASTAYSSTGTHLDLINCITTFSDAILPILPKDCIKASVSSFICSKMTFKKNKGNGDTTEQDSKANYIALTATRLIGIIKKHKNVTFLFPSFSALGSSVASGLKFS